MNYDKLLTIGQGTVGSSMRLLLTQPSEDLTQYRLDIDLAKVLPEGFQYAHELCIIRVRLLEESDIYVGQAVGQLFSLGTEDDDWINYKGISENDTFNGYSPNINRVKVFGRIYLNNNTFFVFNKWMGLNETVYTNIYFDNTPL